MERVVDQILVGDALKTLRSLPDESVHCVVTSPPYWGLRDYGVPGQLGLEAKPQEYVDRMVEVFREVRRVLRKSGTLWLNMGDCYAGSGKGRNADGFHNTNPNHMQANNRGSVHGVIANLRGAQDRGGIKPKDLVGMPWRLAFALQADGWWLRSDIIWSKPNPMPESVTDRPTKAHEYVFLLAKSERYYYDIDAVREPQKTLGELHNGRSGYRDGHPSKNRGYTDGKRTLHPLGRNRRSVWDIPMQPTADAHFATFPEKLVEPCILAGCPEGGVVLDPFMGAGTVALVAIKARRHFIGIELNPKYAEMARQRIAPELAQGRLA